MIRSALALFVAVAVTTGCATTGAQKQESSGNEPVSRAMNLIGEKKYAEALDILKKAFKKERHSALAPDIKYRIATIYVASDNPHKDYAKALTEFDEFVRLYPEHEKAVEARSWKLAIGTILDEKKENERLRKSIEGLKELDIRQEQKRLGR